MPARARTQRVLDTAIKQAPATIAKQHRGQHPKNRTRAHFVAWTVSQLLETYQDPRAILLEIASTPTIALARILAGRRPGADDDATLPPAYIADALAERRLCAQAVLPYVAQKLPVQVDMRHTKAIHLNIVDERQFTELLNLADTDALDPNDQVQLVQGLVIDNDTPAHTTANGLQTATDALRHAEQSGPDAQHALASDTTSRTPGGVEDRGLGLRKNDERNNSA